MPVVIVRKTHGRWQTPIFQVFAVLRFGENREKRQMGVKFLRRRGLQYTGSINELDTQTQNRRERYREIKS